MQQVQDRLDFDIERPSDAELQKRFAKEFNQRQVNSDYTPKPKAKHKKRVGKNAKKLARSNKQFKKAKYKRSLVEA